ncbi:hypothetical protein ACWELQ_44255, partial [Nocardia sp. NPDC004722]
MLMASNVAPGVAVLVCVAAALLTLPPPAARRRLAVLFPRQARSLKTVRNKMVRALMLGSAALS